MTFSANSSVFHINLGMHHNTNGAFIGVCIKQFNEHYQHNLGFYVFLLFLFPH